MDVSYPVQGNLVTLDTPATPTLLNLHIVIQRHIINIRIICTRYQISLNIRIIVFQHLRPSILRPFVNMINGKEVRKQREEPVEAFLCDE